MSQRNGTPKNKFSAEEDEKLRELVSIYGHDNWREIIKHIPQRTVRQCRERWFLYISPEVSNKSWTKEEDDLLRLKVIQYGHRWKLFEGFFGDRTSVNIKNRWKLLKRRTIKNIISKKKKDVSIDSKFYNDEVETTSDCSESEFEQFYNNNLSQFELNVPDDLMYDIDFFF